MHARPAADVDRLIGLLAAGHSIADATAAAGIPRSTYDSWRRRSPELRDRIDRARQGPPADPEPERPVGEVRVQLPSRDQLLGLLVRTAISNPGSGASVRAIEILLKTVEPEPPPASRLVALVERMWAQ
jgi:hypothetical protein